MNPYYSPEDYGLRIFGQLDDPAACYSFNYFIVWERIEDGVLYYGTDSGCSCPSPFESTGLDDLAKVEDTTESWDKFVAALNEYCGEITGSTYGYDRTSGDAFAADCGELQGKVSQHLSKVAHETRTVGGQARALSAELAARNAELGATKEELARVEHQLEVLRSGVAQQDELWTLLRTVHRELDLWFNDAVANPAEAKQSFEVKAARSSEVGK